MYGYQNHVLGQLEKFSFTYKAIRSTQALKMGSAKKNEIPSFLEMIQNMK